MVMRALAYIFVLLILTVSVESQTFGADRPETPRLVFVTEYVRELAAIENIRAAAEQELKAGGKEDVLSKGVYTSTRMQLELRTQIATLKGMRLNPPFEKVIANLTGLYQQKIELHQKLVEIASAFIAGPKPNVDFGKMAAEMPQIRALLDDIDQSIFTATPLVFATLIDMKEDSEHHVSHLNIAKAERAQLIRIITTDFGSKLDQSNQNSIVSAASVLKAYLLKDFQSSDEPWQ